MWFPIGVLCAILYGVIAQTPQAPRVTISQGNVVGVESDGYYGFFGIPYADSTSGSNRFKAPSTPPTFTEDFIANRKNIKCVRALGLGYEGTEDCLVVDVMTPTLDRSRRLPVMVWINGKELDKAYVPEFSFNKFMDQDVIIVSLNYRESILGFLCLGTETAPGNAGLKDIIAALKWVQTNIVAFGGDPENVSLFGHGSGAAAVDLVTLSPMAQGLLHKAIAQSGTALSPWAVTRNNLKYAINVAEALGHTITDIKELSEVFTRTNLAALMAVINELELTDNSLAFAPCIENTDLDNIEPFLIKSPFEIIRAREQLSVPFITGYVDIEGTIRAEEALEDHWLERMEESFIDFVQPDININNNGEESHVIQEIKRFYFGNNPIDASRVNEYLTYHGDTMILVSAIREARLRAASSNAPIYLYQFSHRGPLGNMFTRPIEITAAGHSEELAYLFYNEENVTPIEGDYLVSAVLLERWTNFARTGIPSSDLSSAQWLPFTSNSNNFLRILDATEITDNENTFEVLLTNPHPTKMSFWNSLYEVNFVDAISRWSLNDRNDEEDIGDEDDGSGDDGEDEDIDGSGEEGDDDEDDNDDDEDDNDDDDDEDGDVPDSASTSVAYTFTIVIFFALLNKLHNLQLLS